MHLVLRYANGQRVDALMLNHGDGTMRVVVRGRNETLEFHLASQLWIGENGERVCIEAMLPGPYQGGRQTNTKYNETAAMTNTAAAAACSQGSGRMN